MGSQVTPQPARVSFKGPEVVVWSTKHTQPQWLPGTSLSVGREKVCVSVCAGVMFVCACSGSVQMEGAVCKEKEQIDGAEREMHFSNVTLPCHPLR